MTTKITEFSPDINAFIQTFANEIADGAAAIFAGADLSVASGYVTFLWMPILRL